MLSNAPSGKRHRPRTVIGRTVSLAAAVLVATLMLGTQAFAVPYDNGRGSEKSAASQEIKENGRPAHSNAGGSKADASSGGRGNGLAKGRADEHASVDSTSSSTTSASTSTASTFVKPADPGGGGGGGGGGSTGTVKIKTLGGTETRSNEPHRGCIFFIEFWNFAGPGAVTASLDLVTPTEGGITGGAGALDGDGADGSHDATIELNLLDVPDIASVTPHQTGGEPGYHVSVSTTTPTGDQKSKTIWARNCPVTTITPPPTGIDVTKTCPAQAAVDDRIVFRVTVRNSGQEVLNNVVVTDTLLGTLSFPASLTVGQSATQTVDRTVLAADPDPLVNTVTATAVGATSAATVTDTATCSTDIVPEVLGGQVPRPGAPGEPPEVQAEAPAEAALAFTGYWAVPLALVAVGLLLTGSSLLIVGRRRERRSKSP
jgi:uncharacterized repeat protein (TIGR01451 family)